MDKGIRGAISRCVGKNYNKKDIHLLVNHCFRIALAYLEMKLCSHASYFLREEKPEDLAMDFIADLFQRDENGMLIEICAGFRDVCMEECSESDITIRLRRIVFSKVDDNIFRFNGEKDPFFMKKIKNIKLTVRDQEYKKNRVCYRAGYLIFSDVEEPSGLMTPYDFISNELYLRLSENNQIPNLIIKVIDIINFQDDYLKRLSLFGLASIIRESYVLLKDEEFNPFMNSKSVNNFFEKEFDTFNWTTHNFNYYNNNIYLNNRFSAK